MDWTQYNCPLCDAAYCICTCKEQWEEMAWKYYGCNMCGVKAGTKCDCVPLSGWEWFKGICKCFCLKKS